ncbi:MAG: hypothetical protein JO269_10255 [Burkholderiaceae bacterium]|nr:hypothetical protein [Burkholderiaceae bacterium]
MTTIREPSNRLMMQLPAWMNNESAKTRLRKAGRRIVFSLLSLWLHGAALFFLSMVLFTGRNSSGLGSPGPRQAQTQTVEVKLQTVPQQSDAASAGGMVQEAEKQIEFKQQIARDTVDQHADSAPKETASKAGLLSCDALERKPQRILFGDDYVQTMHDHSPPGRMVLHETINREGRVIAVRVEDSTMSKAMEDQVIAWAYRSFYRPGQIGAAAVECDMKYVVSPTPYDAPRP